MSTKIYFRKTLAIAIFCAAAVVLCAQEPEFERKTKWHGYEQSHFQVRDREAYMVAPVKPADGRPWIWRARFPSYHAEMDIELVAQGFHIGYVDVAGLFGSPQAIEIGDAFYEHVTTKYELSKTPVLEGVSRGGLFVYNWAVKNPDKVACIYCDTPVCDMKSWPGGKGAGLGSPSDWTKCLQAYELTEHEAELYQHDPTDEGPTAIVAKAAIPILHIVSENDRVVPPIENTYLLQQRMKQSGHNLEVISVPEGTQESNGHHFTHPDPQRVIRFVLESLRGERFQKATVARQNSKAMLDEARRIVFLGDSITYSGQYVARFEAWLLTQRLDKTPTVINVGLSSETVSGLSEDGHAGGRFPRPDLAERLDRVLAETKPDLVFACYGINCAIYQPFNDERFRSYQQGIRNLKQHVEAANAKLILITPPTFDDQRANKPFSYNAVLDRYSDWLISLRDQGWEVIDLHGQMVKELLNRRVNNPDFTFQPDGVHPNAAGHEFIANQLIDWFGGEVARLPNEQLQQVVYERMKLLRDAYLTKSGHKRPGVMKGYPIAWAKDRAEPLTAKIRDLLETNSVCAK